VKAAYKATNRRRGQFVDQLIANEAVSELLKEDEEDEAQELQALEDDASSSSSLYDADVPRRSRQTCRKRRLPSRRKYSKKKTLDHIVSSRSAPVIATLLRRSAQFNSQRGVQVLKDSLECDETTPVCTSSNLYYGDSSAPRRGRIMQTIRCAPSFHGAPWMDWLRYKGTDGVRRVGEAVVVLNTRARGW